MVNFRGLVEFLDKYFIFNTSEPFISRKNFLTNSILFEYTQMTRKFENDISLIKNEYLGVLDKLVGDEYWRCSILELANFFSKKNKVFVYAFDHRLSKSRWPVKRRLLFIHIFFFFNFLDSSWTLFKGKN